MLTSEQMIVGAILGDPRTIKTIRAEIAVSDFQTDEGKAIFRAACSLDDDNAPIDPIQIKARAAEHGTDLSDRGLLEAMEVAAVQPDLSVHIQGMKDSVLRSRLLESVSSAYTRLATAETPRIVCADLQADIQSVMERDQAHGLASGIDLMSEYVDLRIAMEEGRRRAFVPTGYNALDNSLGGGMVPEGLYILAARPGNGKTTMALAVAERVAGAGIPVLFISLEMSNIQLTARRLADETGIPAQRILLHSLEDKEHEEIAAAMDKLAVRPLFFNRVRRARVGDIGVMARQVKDCGLVILDYLGLLTYEPGKSLYEQVTKTSNSLKRLASSLGIPVLCLAQLNRRIEGHDGPPRLSDLRDSGAIEQDADGVLLLHRPPYEDNGGPAPLSCVVAKNRHGESGKAIEFNWYLRNGRIRAAMNERPKYF